MTQRRRRISYLNAIAVFVLSACAAQTPVNSRLDTSGLTIVTLDDAVVLARPVRQITAAARDYAYIGPVEINRMGNRDHYLWVGLASTVDRAFADVAPAGASSLALLVDGQPMKLPLSEWSMTLDEPPYRSTVPIYATFSAHASLDQIQRIASANSVAVHIVTDSGQTTHYQRWHGAWQEWSVLSNAE